jgi:hypothetical protein
MTAQNPAYGDTLGRLARDDVPFLFDAIAVQPDGAIVHTARKTLNFSFDYHGANFLAQCRRVYGRFVVTVTADLGPLPFSAESLRARREIQHLIAMGGHGGAPLLTIANDQAIRIESSFDLLQPVSPVVMLTAVTELLLDLKPTLARLSEILSEITPPAQGAA